MPNVHPSAILDPRVQLADDALVGPFCSVEGDVTIGQGTQLLRNVHLYGPLTIGAENTLYPNVCIGFAPQDLKFDASHDGPGVVIGDRNVFREGVTIHRTTGQTPTTIGDRNFFMVNSHLAHDVVIGNDAMLANGALVAGHVTIGDRVILGGNAAIHQFCRVGRIAILSGVAGITHDLPPFALMNLHYEIALNRVGLRRAGLRDHIAALDRAYRLMFRHGHVPRHGADLAEKEVGQDPLVAELISFIRTSDRGVMTGRSRVRRGKANPDATP